MNADDTAIESLRLATLLELEQSLREAENESAWGFTLANELLRLLPYRQAVVLEHPGKQCRVTQVSGISALDPEAPMLRWLERFARSELGPEPLMGNDRDLPEAHREAWSEWGSSHWLYLPLAWPADSGKPLAGLLLLRDEAPTQADLTLLDRLAAAAAHALHGLRGGKRPRPGHSLFRSLIPVALLISLTASFFIPIRQSVLAPAEVGTRFPHVITAPQDGVIADVRVRPNQMVNAGDLLVTLDDTLASNRLAVAEKALAVAESQHRQAVQGAFVDASRKADVAVLQARIEKTRAELAQARDLLSRSVIRAERDGIAIFPDVSELLGRPVQVGERIMELADPADANVVAWIAVADAIELPPDAEVRFFLNTAPEAPLTAHLSQVAYQPELSPAGILAFRVRGKLESGDAPPRIGLQGTARVYGGTVSLFEYLLRRPLAAARPWLGF